MSQDEGAASGRLGSQRPDLPRQDQTDTGGRMQQRGGLDAVARHLTEIERPFANDNRIRLSFLAQQIAQEVLSSGLHWEPWAHGSTAYRRAGGEPPLVADGGSLVQMAV